MNDASQSPRIRLIREAAVLQLKLMVDGLRDALLIPFSLLAALVGVLRGGDDCDREFRQVLKLGRRSERWINLFGHARPLGRSNRAGSMDAVLEQAESAVLKQYRKGKEREGGPETGAEPGSETPSKADAGPETGRDPGQQAG